MTDLTERYSVALSSKRLEATVRSGDIDVFWSAGLADRRRDGEADVSLGLRLIRLRAEFDARVADPGWAQGLRANPRAYVGNFQNAAPAYRRLFAMIRARAPDDTPDADCQTLVHALVTYWCDPRCLTCGGSRLIGQFGMHQRPCLHCKGTGRSRPQWQPRHLRRLGDELFSEMEVRVSNALAKINRFLRSSA